MAQKINITVGVDPWLVQAVDDIAKATRRVKASLIREGLELVVSKYRRNPSAHPQEGIDDDILAAGSFGLASGEPQRSGPVPIPQPGPVSLPGVPSQPMGPAPQPVLAYVPSQQPGNPAQQRPAYPTVSPPAQFQHPVVGPPPYMGPIGGNGPVGEG